MSIVARLDMQDRMSDVATCRHFCAFRALAWARITLTMHDTGELTKKLRQLADTLKADASLQPYICNVLIPHVRDSGFADENSGDWLSISQLDIAIAGVLLLTPKLECFVFRAPDEDGSTFELTL
jgi:hypothetical protein